MSGGKKRRSAKKASSKKASKGKKSSKKMSQEWDGKKKSKKSKKTSRGGAPKRTMPAAAKAFTDLVKIVSTDRDVPIKYNVAMRVAKAYKDDIAKDHPNMASGDVINKAKKDYAGESDATKKKYLHKAEKLIEDAKDARKAKKANN